MSYEQIVKKALAYGFTLELAEDIAMRIILLGGDQDPVVIDNVLRIELSKREKNQTK